MSRPGAGANRISIESVSSVIKGMGLALLAACLSSHPSFALADPPAAPSAHRQTEPVATGSKAAAASRPERADFEAVSASQDARNLADWVVASGDNHGMPFAIVDKKNAEVFVFKPNGNLRGASPALLGLTRGDKVVPGIGNRKLSSIRPDERITPAGRFVADLGHELHGEEILWVDYDDSIAMHRVITSNPKERRAQRLATPTTSDNRISYGCINVPARFYDRVVSPAFTGTSGIVYVLPEILSPRKVFAAYGAYERMRAQVASAGKVAAR